jgi:hypothetical protein
MGLADDLRQAQVKAPNGCKIVAILGSLTKDDADALAAALDLDKRELPHNVVAKLLGKHGHPVGPSTVGLHRNGGCACGPR